MCQCRSRKDAKHISFGPAGCFFSFLSAEKSEWAYFGSAFHTSHHKCHFPPPRQGQGCVLKATAQRMFLLGRTWGSWTSTFVVRVASSPFPAAEQLPRMGSSNFKPDRNWEWIEGDKLCLCQLKEASALLEVGSRLSPQVEETWSSCSKMWVVP